MLISGGVKKRKTRGISCSSLSLEETETCFPNAAFKLVVRCQNGSSYVSGPRLASVKHLTWTSTQTLLLHLVTCSTIAHPRILEWRDGRLSDGDGFERSTVLTEEIHKCNRLESRGRFAPHRNSPSHHSLAEGGHSFLALVSPRFRIVEAPMRDAALGLRSWILVSDLSGATGHGTGGNLHRIPEVDG